MFWGGEVVVLGLIAKMLWGVPEVLVGVDDCSWEVWVFVREGLFK